MGLVFFLEFGRRGRCWGRLVALAAGGAAADLAALTALDKVRTTVDLPLLIKRLKTPIQNLEDDLKVQSRKI